MSKPRTGSREESSRRISAAQRPPASASGTLNQKTHCQEIATRAPPSTGPMTSPIAATIVFVPIARPSCSCGKASVTRAGPLAKMKAPPTPWRMRQRISSVPFEDVPAPSEAKAKRRKAPTKAVLRPKRSESRPAVSTRTVEEIM